MKLRKLKAVPLALVTLFTLTSCKLIDNIIGSILVNTVMDLPVLINRLDLMPSAENTNPTFVPFENPPSSEANRAELNYLKNVLVVPRDLETVVFNKTIKLHFDFEFSGEGATNAFHVIDVTESDLPENFRFDTSAFPVPITYKLALIVPVGESTILEGVTNINQIQTVLEDTPRDELVESIDQEPLNATMKVIARSAGKSKSKNFYFNLTKPLFGAMVLEEVFKSGYLINLYRIHGFNQENNEVESTIENVADLPSESENPLNLSYFLDSIAIPKIVTLKDLGDVTFEVTTNRPDLLFIGEMSKPIEDLDPGNELITGDVTVHTLTPVGTYSSEIPASVDTVDKLKDHLKSVDVKELYPYATQPTQDFSITITATCFGEERTETYYFRLQEPPLDQEIVDYAIKSEYMINKVFYKDTTSIIRTTRENMPSTPEKRMKVSYLTETLAIPRHVVLSDFGNKELDFSINVLGNNADKFYMSEQTDTLDGNPVTVKTLTPVGGLAYTTPQNDLPAFAEEIKGLSREDLYDCVTQTSIDVDIELSATLNGKTATKTYYFTLVAADIDVEIIDYLIDDSSLLNVVTYEDVNDDVKIQKIADQAKDPLNPYAIEHLVDTIVVPQSITLTNFGNRELQIETTINSDDPGALNFYEASKSATISDNLVTAKTLTPLGSYDASAVDPNNLTALADSIKALPTKDLYKHSQSVGYNVELNVTVTLVSGEGEPEVRSTTFYLKTIKADVDSKIGTAILDTYDIVNLIDHTDPYINVTNPPQPTDPLNPYQLLYFGETLVFPIEFEYTDFENKLIQFDVNTNGKDHLFFISQKTHHYEGKDVEGITLSPIGTYDPGEPLNTYQDLINHLKNDANIMAIAAARAVQVEENVTITVTISIDGREVAVNNYYFVLVVERS
ncbi:MAG: hypothetical protein BWX57_00862 [Tenericutes bacterium ADurb.Bin024]|jgi:hypothetical protein|nr:MAG: hypothetical protein BWX57_00862 [Tenericutes bacterium ADurb.Bin024]